MPIETTAVVIADEITITKTAGALALKSFYEYFTDQNTDSNGELVLALAETPSDVKKVAVVCTTDEMFATVKSLSNNDLTITIHDAKYQKTTAVSGALGNLPASVTEETGSTITSTASANIGTVQAFNGNEVAQASHTHTHNKIFQHDHSSLTQSATELDLAADESGTVNVLVFYDR